MRVLEARFHPRSKKAPPVVVVGRVRWAEDRPAIETTALTPLTIRPFDASALFAKLRFLVESAGSKGYDQLISLRSDYWSFVEADPHP
jgi:hypothetical protein